MSAIRAAVLLCASLAWPTAGEAARSDWSEAGEAQLRLLALPPDERGIVTAGVEIAMTPGWHTYWRNPGEVGIPPRFDFAGSENVAAVDVRYPAPQRLDDGTSISVVYQDQVVFPVRVTPQNPDRPVSLRVAASFGVCNTICIPASAEAEVAVAPGAGPDPLAETTLASAADRVPGPPETGRFDIAAVAPDPPDSLEIAVTVPPSAYFDLFVDPPAGWSIGQPTLLGRDGSMARYRLSLLGRPAGASAAGQLFRFVAVAGSEAIEETVRVP